MTRKEQGSANATIIGNRKLRDSSSKVIFEDNTLSSQFLRDYADLDILRHIKPEDVEDVSAFTDLSAKGLENILRETPDYLLGKIADVLRALLYRMELPENTVEDTVAKIKERKMGILFENIKMNIPEEKRKAEIARREKEIIEGEIKVIQREKEVIQREKEVIQQERDIYKCAFDMMRQGCSDEVLVESLMREFSLDEEQVRDIVCLHQRNSTI